MIYRHGTTPAPNMAAKKYNTSRRQMALGNSVSPIGLLPDRDNNTLSCTLSIKATCMLFPKPQIN